MLQSGTSRGDQGAAQHGHVADAATRRQDRAHFRNQFQLDTHSDSLVRRG
jgi:hypothetical protein